MCVKSVDKINCKLLSLICYFLYFYKQKFHIIIIITKTSFQELAVLHGLTVTDTKKYFDYIPRHIDQMDNIVADTYERTRGRFPSFGINRILSGSKKPLLVDIHLEFKLPAPRFL